MKQVFKVLTALFAGSIVIGIVWFGLLSTWYLTLSIAKLLIPFIYPHYYVALAAAGGVVGFVAYFVGSHLSK